MEVCVLENRETFQETQWLKADSSLRTRRHSGIGCVKPCFDQARSASIQGERSVNHPLLTRHISLLPHTESRLMERRKPFSENLIGFLFQGDLAEILSKKGALPAATAIRYALDIARYGRR